MAMSRTGKTLLIISSIVLVLVLVVVVGIAVLVAAFRQGVPSIRDNSVLALRVSGALPDYVPEDPFRKLFGGTDQSLTNLVLQFKKAKVDKRIKAILLEIDSTSGAGWGKSEEIRDAIADFRSAGKPVYAYMELGMNKEYYIASACDRIYMAPPGELFINGLAADVMFFRGSLDKLGVYPDMYQIGKYKSAGDMFTRKEMSEAHREYVNSLLDDLFNRYLAAIAAARGKSVEDVRALIDNAPYGAAKAKEAGLIDGVGYRDELDKELKAKLGYKETEDLPLVRAGDYKQVSPESLDLNKGEKVAVIYGTGSIGSGKSENGPGGQSIGSDTMAKALNDARDDKTIKAIIVRVDSPGGSGLASDIIWHAVEAAKQKKPVVISMGDVAASGGYYIAAGASKIIAQPSTITGSIGVVGGKPVIKRFYDWIGVTNEYVLRGKQAGMFRETEKFTPDERAKFEEWIKTTYYSDFVPKVARGRNKDVEYVDSVGQGRVWTGAQGKENGLVDEFGGLDRAIEVAKQLANIPAEKGVQRVIFPYPTTFLQELMNLDNNTSTELQQQRAVIAALPEDAQRAFRYMKLFDQMKNGQAMLLMPFDLRIR